MKKIYNDELLCSYLKQREINKFFSTEVLSLFELFSFKEGEFIITEGFCSDYLYFMTSGKARVYAYSPSGNIMLLSFAEPFQLLGESASLWGKEAIANVQAVTDGTCIGISLSKYRNVLLDDRTFLRHTCEMLANKLYICNTVFGRIFLSSIESRLAFYILQTSHNNMFSSNLTECAEILSTSYRHLLRVLNAFCTNGLLEKQGKDYCIINYDELKKLAHQIDEP
ncbi:MAG: cyclic nucleotide-binding domain-containing protein [Cellulosilyticaceae bacterium]